MINTNNNNNTETKYNIVGKIREQLLQIANMVYSLKPDLNLHKNAKAPQHSCAEIEVRGYACVTAACSLAHGGPDQTCPATRRGIKGHTSVHPQETNRFSSPSFTKPLKSVTSVKGRRLRSTLHHGLLQLRQHLITKSIR